MKKFLPHILILGIVGFIITAGILFPSHAVNAMCPIKPLDCLSEGIGWIAIAILKLVGLITMLAGTALNYVVWYTVVHMADNFSKITAIDSAWGVIRDVANMGFIFVLLYAAIQMILGEGKDTRRLIVNMIIAAILINFSLFFTKIIIDVANVIAVTFYHAIAPDVTSGTSVAEAMNILTQSGISNSLMAPMGISSIWNAVGAGTITGSQLITIGVMGSVVALVAAFVFAAIAAMFAIRYVVLILVLILSPLMFVAMILPQLQSYTKQWWDALIGQAFFAPVYMLLTWIVIQIINSPEFKVASGTANLADTFIGVAKDQGSQIVYSPGGINLVVNFVVIIILLIASLVIAKQVAGKAGGQVAGITKWATGLAGGATLGLAGRFARGTIGRAGQHIADNQALKDAAPTSRLARLQLAGGKILGGTGFDLRGTSVGGELGAGKAGGKGGFRAEREANIKTRIQQVEDFKGAVRAEDLERTMGEIGYSPEENARLGRTVAEIETTRKKVQTDLENSANERTRQRKERFVNNLTNSRWYTPNLYAGAGEDREAAKRMRGGAKAKTPKDDLLEALKKFQDDTVPPPSAPPATP